MNALYFSSVYFLNINFKILWNQIVLLNKIIIIKLSLINITNKYINYFMVQNNIHL